MKRMLVLGLGLLVFFLLLSPVPTAQAADPAADPYGYLEEQGYTVIDMTEGTFKKTGDPWADVIMDWESKDLWSEETSTQVVTGLFALRAGYPKAVSLFVELIYTSQYTVVWRVETVYWDTYQKEKDWTGLKEKWWVGIWDNDASAYLGGTELKNFTKKNFGAGAFAEPKLPGPKNNSGGAYGSLTVEPSVTEIKAKGSLELKVTVLDKQKNPVAKTSVDFLISGTSTGARVLPRAISTNEDGVARATLTVGSADGSVVVTAQAKGTRGTVVIKVGKGDTDPAMASVFKALQQLGYKVYTAGPGKDAPNTVYVDMDILGYLMSEEGVLDPTSLAQIADGWTALTEAYPKATLLVVITRYKETYAVYWPVKPDDFKAFRDQKTDEDTFWTGVITGLKVIDLKTGKEVTPKDFINKNFGGG